MLFAWARLQLTSAWLTGGESAASQSQAAVASVPGTWLGQYSRKEFQVCGERIGEWVSGIMLIQLFLANEKWKMDHEHPFSISHCMWKRKNGIRVAIFYISPTMLFIIHFSVFIGNTKWINGSYSNGASAYLISLRWPLVDLQLSICRALEKLSTALLQCHSIYRTVTTAARNVLWRPADILQSLHSFLMITFHPPTCDREANS